ncbi:MAG: sugar transferase [Patescibacteria group bacterium]|nr:sugar transferase [Patescibacteria group bacterium]
MYRIKQFILFLGDILSLYAGLFLALSLRYLKWPEKEIGLLLEPMILLFILAAIFFFIVGLYDLGKAKNSWKFFQKIIISALLWIAFGTIYFYLNSDIGAAPKTNLLLIAVFGFTFVSLWRYLQNKILTTTWKIKVVFAGINKEAVELINLLRAEPQHGYEIIGIISENASDGTDTVPVGKNLKELFEKTKQKSPNMIVVSPEFAMNDEILNEFYGQIFRHSTVVDLADFYEEIFGRLPSFIFSESWFLTKLREQDKKIYDRMHNLIDYASGLLMGIFFAITFPFVALAIKSNSRGSIFFKQERTGKSGKKFTIYKYRTMKSMSPDGSAEISGPQFASTGDARITLVGKFLRKTRLDEIPQFINILKKEMSLVGPRPERPEFVKQLTEKMPFYALRHLVKPGITGWAQLHESYYGTIEENLRKLEYDLFYIKNRGPVLDMAILLKTINVILRFAGR